MFIFSTRNFHSFMWYENRHQKMELIYGADFWSVCHECEMVQTCPVQWQEDDHCVKHILEAEVRRSRSQGRQRKRWINTISQDIISLNLTPVDVEDRDEWRRRTRVADLCG